MVARHSQKGGSMIFFGAMVNLTTELRKIYFHKGVIVYVGVSKNRGTPKWMV